jgi:uncharacterized glyoxalase superfamily protein PhnB
MNTYVPPQTPDVNLEPGIPVLRIFSVEKALEFYVDFLGFTVDWGYDGDNHDQPLYAQVSRSGMTLHLSEHYGDACPGATIFIRMTGIDAFHRELEEKNYRYARPGIEQAPDDAREIEVTDPFGNRLRFSESPP